MRKFVLLAVIIAAALAGVAFYSGMFSRGSNAAAGANAGGPGGAGANAGGRQGGAGPGGAGGRGGGRGQVTVELANATRAKVDQELTVVGNLVGDATVSVVPKANGRLQEISVRLGDRVTRGQRIAKIEDEDIVEQVKQAEAAFQVASATIRQREADLQLAKTSVERSRNLFQRQLLPQQTLDDSEAKYQSAQAALDLARAQNTQSQARLDELKVNLQNTVITSPVNGFVARRTADPGAFVSPNAPIVDVVDITKVRLVVNVVEKDLKQIGTGDMANVGVDAYPGERFAGRIARVSPVLDPATRTAPIEIEIQNAQFRLKPGMYARVGIVTDSHPNAIVVPSNALVDVNGARGVYLAVNNVANFHPVKVGIEGNERTEILDGLAEGDRIVTTGAGALRNGDAIVLAGAQGGGRGGRGRGRGGDPNGGANGGAQGPVPQGQAPRGSSFERPQGDQGQGAGQRNGGGRRGGGSGGRRGEQPAGAPAGGNDATR